jgi:excinuclease ABC subunit C
LGGYLTESERFLLINLPHTTNLIKLLQRIRDESHRFAVSYHSSLKLKRQTSSQLEDIPGVGPTTRKRLIKQFGSLRSVLQADEQALAATVGPAKARLIKHHLKDK